ncbi:hypothetical protein [Nocardioides sp.]
MGTIVSIIVGGAVAAATVVGVVNAQTAAPEQSPVNVSKVGLSYGSN